MLKFLLTGLLLCSSPMVFAQDAPVGLTEEAIQTFLSKPDLEKQSELMDLLAVNKYAEAKLLLTQWEQTAPEGKGPSDFLKSYINGFVESEEKKEQ